MNKKILLISGIIFIFLYKVKINSFVLISQIQGFSLFILLYHIGHYLMKKKIQIIFIEISRMSYSIYLFHHKIIFDILSLNNPTEWYIHIVLLFIIIILAIICSEIHLMVVNSIIKSHKFKKLESLFIWKTSLLLLVIIPLFFLKGRKHIFWDINFISFKN